MRYLMYGMLVPVRRFAHCASSIVSAVVAPVVGDREARRRTWLVPRVSMALPARIGMRRSLREPMTIIWVEFGGVVEALEIGGREAMLWRILKICWRANLAVSSCSTSLNVAVAGSWGSSEQKSQHSVSGARERSTWAAVKGALEED